jgi:hypothetical protein
MYGKPFDMFTIENPTAPDCAISVAPVDTTPAGKTQAPVAVVQNANPIEPILAPVAVVAATT